MTGEGDPAEQGAPRAPETKLGQLAPGEKVIADLMALLRAWAADETAPPPASPVLSLLPAAQLHGVLGPVCAALSRAAPGAALLLRPAIAGQGEAAENAFRTLTLAAGTLRDAGVSAIAVKGGAMLALGGAPAPMRTMADVDLLAPKGRMGDAVAALRDAGWTTDTGRFDLSERGVYAHPALTPPGGGLMLELHRRCAYDHGRVLEGLEERAVPTAVPGLRAPAPDDRLAHLVHHAQIMDRGHRRRVARLRDAVEWREIVTRAGADPKAVAERFARSGAGAEFTAFAALARRVWDPDAPASEAAEADARWVAEALAGMADPATLHPFVRADYRRVTLELLTSPGLLHEMAARMASPDFRGRTLPRIGRLFRRAILRREG